MTNFMAGHAAELRAARYLERRGFSLREMNWRTRWCEIDIVASRGACMYFVEVKYRRDPSWGDAIESVGGAKLARMEFAARCWQAEHRWGGDARLAVVTINGSVYRLELLDA